MEKPRLDHLIDFLVQLRRDADRDEVELRRRDRAIGRRLAPRGLSARAQLLAWLDEVRKPPEIGRRAAAVQRAAQVLLAAAGFVLGAGALRVLLRYDGTEPVNVIGVLAVFVGLQLALALALGLALLPPVVLRLLPGARALQEALPLLSPGQLLRLTDRFLPAEYRQAAQAALGRAAAHRKLFGRVQKWAVVFAAQGFAVAFNAGALAACLYLIVFSDLAFSWSTTLAFDAGYLHRLTTALSAPWAWLFPQGRPSLELIDATRYFRFKEGVLPHAGPGGGDPAVLGGWWPFLLGSLAFYGLGLRVALWAVARWRYACAVDAALFGVPDAQDVRDRLGSELVRTQAEEPEAGRAEPLAPPWGAGEETPPRVERPCTLVNWGQVDAPDPVLGELLLRELGLRAEAARHAGGSGSLEDDRRVADEIAAPRGGGAVAIVVKAWEPALLEFLDFLQDLRRLLGEGRPIVVAPVGRGDAGGLSAPLEADVAQWRTRVRAVGDPWLSVRPLGGGP
ncbi:MAG: DUF2868 domain-containing protein [Deferrisomatales bacterium]|nr:DUF2868 domain-containing protein [Deferrisomatales bacterium]